VICYVNGYRIIWPREPGRWGWIIPPQGEHTRFRPAIPLEASGPAPDPILKAVEEVVRAARG
jgi:hypothetical protein